MPRTKTTTTSKTPRELWIAALRSGKYAWGKHRLRSHGDKFCCLGVGCEVALEHGVIKRYVHDNPSLPKKVQKWLGLTSVDGDFGGLRSDSLSRNSLIEINDDAKRNPFRRIADLLEHPPTGLFKEKETSHATR